jgi:hypothetical protein
MIAARAILATEALVSLFGARDREAAMARLT